MPRFLNDFIDAWASSFPACARRVQQNLLNERDRQIQRRVPNFNITIWHGGLSLIVSKQHEKAATPCVPAMMSLPNFIFG